MNTDGGGWTLVLNYLHQGGDNPSLSSRSTTPLLVSSSLGTNGLLCLVLGDTPAML